MSFLSGIASDIKSLATDPGKIAKDVCDAVLPSNMKAVGDIVGGAIDAQTGHPLQALSHMADALKDLPQMAQGLPGSSTTAAKAAATPAGTAAAEPTPPPPRPPSLQEVISELTALANGGKPVSTTPTTATAATATTAAATTATAAPTTTAATIPVTGTAIPTGGAPAPLALRVPGPISNSSRDEVSVSVNVGGTTVTVTENMATPRHSGAPSQTGWHSAPTLTVNTTPTSSTSSNGSGSATGTATATASTAPATASPAAASSATGGTSSTPATTTTGTATAGTATAATSSSAGATSATGAAATTTPSSLSSLMAMSNDQFMQAVTSGNIPADVANNPSAMAEIQARMNQITQMNQLVTSMMAAMHQMQMAIIQNIRV